MKITVYTKNKCSQCLMSKYVLNDLAINYIEKNVDTNEKFMDEAKATGYKSMPIILKDGQVIASGFMPDVLNQLEWGGLYMIDKDVDETMQEFVEIDPSELTDRRLEMYEAYVNNALLDAQLVSRRRSGLAKK